MHDLKRIYVRAKAGKSAFEKTGFFICMKCDKVMEIEDEVKRFKKAY